MQPCLDHLVGFKTFPGSDRSFIHVTLKWWTLLSGDWAAVVWIVLQVLWSSEVSHNARRAGGRLTWEQKRSDISVQPRTSERASAAGLQFLLVSPAVGGNQTATVDFLRSAVHWKQSQSILKTGVFSNCRCTQTWPFLLTVVDEGRVIDL